MQIKLEKLTFKTFTKNINEMFDLLDTNRERLSPWFWWADKKVSPTKIRFSAFMYLYLFETNKKHIMHTINPHKLYDEQFLVYNTNGKIAGMVGLDNIDTKTNKNAELWGLAFKGNNQTIETMKIFEDYCINTLDLKYVYGKVQSTNRASKYFWEKYGYDSRTLEKQVCVSKHNPNIADMYTYTKILAR